jgi:GntR family transcriptional regulator/MocR family aminotransferase
MPIGRRYELINWAVSNDSYIIEDDYDSELRYFGRPIPALKSLPNHDRVIYLGSFSSTLFAALKISYMVLPEKMAKLFSSMATDYNQTCSKLEQLTLALFMETGNYQIHIKKLRKLYAQKLSSAIDALTHAGGNLLEISNTSSGLNLVLRIKADIDPKQIKEDALNLGVQLIPVNNSGTFMLYYNQIPLQEIPSKMTSLVASWQKLL